MHASLLRRSVALTALLSACGSGAATRSADTMKPRSALGAALSSYYVEHSMLQQADHYAAAVSGSQRQWNGPYLHPAPDTLTAVASDYLTLYPRSYLTSAGRSVLGTLAESALWSALSQLGITLVHPLAIERAGQVMEQGVVASIDGGFDRISYEIEPSLGTEQDFKRLVQVARQHGAMVVGDIIPLHSGLGYDFRLAEMNQQPYPGMYDMIEVPARDWALLPPVADPWGVAVITRERADALIHAGYMPGKIAVLVGSAESVDWSGWAATGEVQGVDGKVHRWIYAHLFEPGQPKYNWMDPSYAGRRSQLGDLVRQVVGLDVRFHRLDAVPFLGLEPHRGSADMQSYMTELSIAGTNDLAYSARRLGAWTWVELNIPSASYLDFMKHGADFGYDFFTRAETLHPLITADARLLRQAHRALLDSGIRHNTLIHALQNHDEITYQLVDLRAREQVRYGQQVLNGAALAERVLLQAQRAVAGDAAPYNLLYRPERDGIATTYAGFIAAALGIEPYHATPEQVELIKHAHVLIARITAFQPGLFSLSQWDLVGALPLDRSTVEERVLGGDVRWINRGAIDLMGDATTSVTADAIPRAQTLYAPLPRQLQDPRSFASQLVQIIRARKAYGIAQASVVDVPELEDDALCMLVMALPTDVGGVAVSVANYGRAPAKLTVDLSAIEARIGPLSGLPRDILSNEDLEAIRDHRFTLTLEALSARAIAVGARPRRRSGGEK